MNLNLLKFVRMPFDCCCHVLYVRISVMFLFAGGRFDIAKASSRGESAACFEPLGVDEPMVGVVLMEL